MTEKAKPIERGITTCCLHYSIFFNLHALHLGQSTIRLKEESEFKGIQLRDEVPPSKNFGDSKVTAQSGNQSFKKLSPLKQNHLRKREVFYE